MSPVVRWIFKLFARKPVQPKFIGMTNEDMMVIENFVAVQTIDNREQAIAIHEKYRPLIGYRGTKEGAPVYGEGSFWMGSVHQMYMAEVLSDCPDYGFRFSLGRVLRQTREAQNLCNKRFGS